MITNRWVFDDAYDAQIQHRDTELDALTRARSRRRFAQYGCEPTTDRNDLR